ncbi:hypothetical protein [Azospirillum brasilense]|uniref:hypothetical protein n=1 Tax=Azospirillum brasilense TaxID=192 RepID=UPI0011781874|nr:hypothetical protein [Azospirillum brasilense]
MLPGQLFYSIEKEGPGLHIDINSEGKPYLVYKIPEDIISFARTKREWNLHFLKVSVGNKLSPVIVSLFDDDPLRPFMVTTPFTEDTNKFWKAFSWEYEAEVYFYDISSRFRALKKIRFNIGESWKQTYQWHDNHIPEGVEYANVLKFVNENFFQLENKLEKATACLTDEKGLDDIFFLDLREIGAFGKTDSKFGILPRTFEDKNDGIYQEHDIATLLSMIFPSNKIMINPFRADNKKEFCDVLVVDENFALIVQSKKRAYATVSDNQKSDTNSRRTAGIIMNGVSQIKGAYRIACSSEKISLTYGADQVNEIRAKYMDPNIFEPCGDHTFSVNIRAKTIFVLVVSNEMYPDNYDDIGSEIVKELSGIGEGAFVGGMSHFANLVYASMSPERLALGIFETWQQCVEEGHLLQFRFVV